VFEKFKDKKKLGLGIAMSSAIKVALDNSGAWVFIGKRVFMVALLSSSTTNKTYSTL